MSVFHDLLKPYSSVVLTVQDNTGLLDGLALDGTQTFSTSFGQPPDQDPYTGRWVLTTLEKVRSSENQRTQYFTATGFSKHMLNLKRVQKSFKNVPMHSAIEQIVNDVLSPEKGLSVRAPAKNMTGDKRMPWTVNGQQVFKAIRHLMLGSASAVDTSSAYVLFETHKSMILDTLENLSKRAGGVTYFQRQLGTDFLGDSARQQFTILAAQEESRADAAATAQDQNQTTRVADIFNTAFKNVNLGSAGKASAIASLAYNSMRVPSFMQDVMAARRKVAGKFDTQALTITVMLNPALDVGSGFTALMSAPPGDTDESGLDRVSGPLICTKLRHTVDLTRRTPGDGPQAVTTVRGCKGVLDLGTES